jgi:hypothetical protein
MRFVELRDHTGSTAVSVNPDTIQYLRPGPNGGTQIVFGPGSSLVVAGYPKDVVDRLQWSGAEHGEQAPREHRLDTPAASGAPTVHPTWPRPKAFLPA